MKKFYLSSFAARAHRDSKDQSRVGQFMPPLLPGDGAMSFDFSPLLVCEKLIIDRTAFDLMVQSDAIPKRVREQIMALSSEGFIEKENYYATSEKEVTAIRQATDFECGEANDAVWDRVLFKCIDDWMEIGETYGEQFGNLVNASGKIPYILNEYIGRTGDYDDIAKAKAVWSELKRGHLNKEGFAKIAVKEMKEILFDYIHTGLVLARKFDAVSYEWENLQSVILEKGKRSAVVEKDNPAQSARKLASMVVPYDFTNWEPKKVLRLLRDKRIISVRKSIQEINELDIDIGSTLRDEIVKAQFDADLIARRKKEYSWYTKSFFIVLGFFIPGASELYKEVGEPVAEAMLEEGIDKAMEPKKNATTKARRALSVIHENLKK